MLARRSGNCLPQECKPRDSVKRLREWSSSNDEELQQWLAKRTQLVMMASVKGSLGAIRSGVQCWLLFATEVLGYAQDAGIPFSMASMSVAS